jgi:hypothetical protein
MRKKFTIVCLAFGAYASAQVSPQTYTTAGSYVFTVPSGVSSLTLEVIGAGGKGISNGGGGGGGGGYASGVYSVTPGATLSVKVGAPNVNPTAGTSSVQGLLSATGGGNGTSVSPNTIIGGAGSAGTGIGGNIVNRTGGAGGDGCWTYFGAGGGGAAGPSANGGNGGSTPVYNGTNCATPGGSGGTGGGAPAGNGGKGAGFTNAGCSTSNPASNPTNFGGGGGAGNGIGSPETNGAVGYVSISWGSACTPPAAPTGSNGAFNSIICSGATASLIAFGTGTVNWYNQASGGTLLSSGNVFTTPNLTTTTTFYAGATNTCASSATRIAVTVTVNPLPNVLALASPSVICANQSSTLTATGASTYVWTPTIAVSGIVSPTATTAYTVVGTATNNCSKQASITLTVNPTPNIVVVANPSTICINQTSTLTASGANIYSWTPGIPLNAIVSPTTTTTYSVVGTATNGCSKQNTVTVNVQLCTGLANNNLINNSLALYPNPSNGEFTIEAPVNATLKITDSKGKLVLFEKLSQPVNVFKLNKLSKGIYFVTLNDSGHISVSKLILE